MSDHVHEFTDDNFQQEVAESSEPVLVDFWASWCSPCRQIAPMIEELANENEGSIKVGKLNVEEAPKTAQEYSVMGLPTLIVFKDGKPAERFQGVQPKARLQEALDAAKA